MVTQNNKMTHNSARQEQKERREETENQMQIQKEKKNFLQLSREEEKSKQWTCQLLILHPMWNKSIDKNEST